MTRRERIKLAASRYGQLEKPSMDAVLSEGWPHYGPWIDDEGVRHPPDRLHVQGYHEDRRAAMKVVEASDEIRKCKECGGIMLQSMHGNREFCSPLCSQQANVRKAQRHAERKRRGRPPKRGKPLTNDDRARIIELYVGEELPIDRIATVVGRAHETVRGVLADAGIKTRGPRPPGSRAYVEVRRSA